MVGPRGLEPLTPTMSTWCSNQLSYEPKISFKINSSNRFLKSNPRRRRVRLRRKLSYEPETTVASLKL